MDIFTVEKRSEVMSSISGKDTKPELLVRRYLHARGLRYRLHDKRLPGKPDISFPSRRIAVFVHGCFWHGHDCRRAALPATRTDFWSTKINRTKQRDARAIASLEEMGWIGIVVWQCELADEKLDELLTTIKAGRTQVDHHV